MKAEPRFRVEGKGTRNPVVWIQCSNCYKDIRKMDRKEKIAVDRGYYCKDCDDGAHHINFPVRSK